MKLEWGDTLIALPVLCELDHKHNWEADEFPQEPLFKLSCTDRRSGLFESERAYFSSVNVWRLNYKTLKFTVWNVCLFIHPHSLFLFFVVGFLLLLFFSWVPVWPGYALMRSADESLSSWDGFVWDSTCSSAESSSLSSDIGTTKNSSPCCQ